MESYDNRATIWIMMMVSRRVVMVVCYPKPSVPTPTPEFIIDQGCALEGIRHLHVMHICA